MKKFFFGFIACLVVLCALAWTPTDRSFNRNQFGTNNLGISIASGVILTNLNLFSNNIVLVSGVTQTPYATLALANAAASAGDTILVKGSNNVAASVAVKSGVTIAGSGLLAGTGLSQPLLIVTNDNVRLEGISIQSDSSGVGVIAAGPFTFTNLLVRGVNVFASTNGFIWKPESGTGANIIQGDFHDVTVNTLTNVPGGGVGFYTHTATNALIRLFNCAMFGSIDAVLAGGTGGDVQILGGTYISQLDAITSGGAHLLVVGAKARGIDQEDLFEDDGTLTALWVDYLNASGNISGVHRIPNRLVVAGAVTATGFTNSSVTSAFTYGDANGKQGEATSANFISTVTGTPTGSKFLRDDWSWQVPPGGGSGDTNAISYVVDGDLLPAVRTRNAAPNDEPVLEMLYTNGVPALVITNHGAADQFSMHIQGMNGLKAMSLVDTGSGPELVHRSTFTYTLALGGQEALFFSDEVRRIRGTNNIESINFGNPERPLFNAATDLNLPQWQDQQFLYLNGTSVETTDTLASLTAGTFQVTTNVIWPAGQLGPSSEVTNYVVNLASTNLQWIMATGNVLVVDFENVTAGQTKYLSVTNVFWGSSNISVYVQTNLGWLGPTNGWVLGASPMHTNRCYLVTNFCDFSFTALGTTDRSIRGFGVHNSP